MLRNTTYLISHCDDNDDDDNNAINDARILSKYSLTSLTISSHFDKNRITT